MKDWNYYSEPQGIKFFGYEEEKAFEKSLRDDINNSPMTAADREMALANVKKAVRDHRNEQNKPYREAQAKLTAEFWQDCREDLGYTDFLNDEGVAALEAKAWEDGHSAGFSEVYGCLIDLSSLAEKLVKHAELPTTVSHHDNGGVPVKRFRIKMPESCEINFDEESGVIIIDN